MGRFPLPLPLCSVASQLFHHFNLQRLSLYFGNEMISPKPGLGFGSALIFHERRRKKGEMSVKARLAIWKGGALLMPLIAHSPRPGTRLQSKGRAGVGVGLERARE